MPETAHPKFRDFPQPPPAGEDALPYAELTAASNFSFLRGASHADELVFRAAELGYRAIAIADRNTLAGVVRAHEAAKQVRIAWEEKSKKGDSEYNPSDAAEESTPQRDLPATEAPPRLIIGARIATRDAVPIFLYAINRAGYGRLCRLLTTGKRRAEKGDCDLWLNDVLEHHDDLLAIVDPDAMPDNWHSAIDPLRDVFSDRLSLLAEFRYGIDDIGRLQQIRDIARKHRVPLVAGNNVHYHAPERRELQDVLTCIREGCPIGDAGYRLFPNGERYLKPPADMHRLYADVAPHAIARALELTDACHFSLDELRYEYPHELVPEGQTAAQYLAELAITGANERYPDGIPESVRQQIERELELISRRQFEPYFLTCYDLVRFARSRGILCQGRGSAANSAVCYCLGVTSVDPGRIDLLFERFVSDARDEPPDIDIDFEHERREEVLQYLYQKYGRERAGLTAEVISYRGRSAVRDVGKALGLSLDMVDSMAKRLDWWDRGRLTEKQTREAGLDPRDPTVVKVLELTSQLLGFPRHLSQHVGGMVMTRGLLCEMVPIENAAMPDRTVIEWDKDDIDALGILKVDVLGLGMLSCISKCLALLNTAPQLTGNAPAADGEGYADEPSLDTSTFRRSTGYVDRFAPVATPDHPASAPIQADIDAAVARARASLGGRYASLRMSDQKHRPLFDLADIPPEDPSVYDMICDADTIGVFQIESRAQMSMLPRLRPRCFYDLVIEVAIVRPGPIQGNMVHPYLRRRNGQEQVEYPSEALRGVLEKTLGVPLFQEQAMRVAMVGAGFSGAEADQLRRAMAAWKRHGGLQIFEKRIIEGMLANGYTLDFAERSYQQIRGFGEYGFPESHAASFALLVYVSCWLKRYHPAAFAAALINSQPMGFYAPAQIVRDARDHGVEVRPTDINFSEWDCTLESPDSEYVSDRQPISDDEAYLSPEHKSQWGRDGPAIRLGLRLLKGMKIDAAERIVAARKAKPFASIQELQRRAFLRRADLQVLAEADALASLVDPAPPVDAVTDESETLTASSTSRRHTRANRGTKSLPRRQALWQVLQLADNEDPLFAEVERKAEAQALQANLPAMPPRQEVLADYATAGLSLKQHPLALSRDELTRMGMITAAEMMARPHGSWVRVAGLVLNRQRPGTASGIVFETLEDETGIVNLILWARIFERYKAAAKHGAMVMAEGCVERQGQVVHVMVRKMLDLSHMMSGVEFRSRDFH